MFGYNTTGKLRLCARKRLYFLRTIHLAVSLLSTLWTGPCQWAWVRAKFCPMPWVSTLEAGFRRLLACSFDWDFWAGMGYLILEDWD
jgi:hypothetical protein